jgi:hypothetical protein
LPVLARQSADYSRRLGHGDIAREKVLSEHAQFRSLWPATARCLAKHL